MNKCLTCGKNCEKEYCFQHAKRKPLPKVGGFKKVIQSANKELRDEFWREVAGISEMNQFFLSIWNKKTPHNCENCGIWLGSEPRTYMFDHCLEKGIEKYKFLALKDENIMYLCLLCHDNKTRGFLSPIMMKKQEELKTKYNL